MESKVLVLLGTRRKKAPRSASRTAWSQLFHFLACVLRTINFPGSLDCLGDAPVNIFGTNVALKLGYRRLRYGARCTARSAIPGLVGTSQVAPNDPQSVG